MNVQSALPALEKALPSLPPMNYTTLVPPRGTQLGQPWQTHLPEHFQRNAGSRAGT